MSASSRISIATICFDGFGDEDFAHTFRDAPALGVPDIEFNAWYSRNLTPSGIDSIIRRCEQTRLRPATLQISPFAPGPEPADLAREVARWMWLFEAAGHLGVRVIKATGAGRDQRGGMDSLISLLREIAPIAEERGLTIAVENHFRNVVEHPDDYRRIFAAIPETAVGMCLDTGHFVASGHDPTAVAKEFATRLVHVDLKDCEVAGTDRFVRFGAGRVDFDGLLAQITSGGYAGYIVVELPLIERSTMASDLEEGVRIARRHLDDQPVSINT